jgi:TRAP-type C4-dicarboxylate transport system permease small subunit
MGPGPLRHDEKPTGRAAVRGAAFDRVLDAYLAFSKVTIVTVSVTIFAAMIAANALEIAGRALFQTSFSWVQEVSILGAMWVYFFAYALIAKNDEYIRVEFITERMRAPLREACLIFARLVLILFHATLAWFALETYQFLGLFTTSVLGWPESLFVLPILLGAIDVVATEAIHLRWQLLGREVPRRALPPVGVD